MRISPVSMYTTNKTNFSSKKENNNNKLKNSVPAAALALAVMASPINSDKAQATTNKESQIYPVVPMLPYYPTFTTFYYYNTYVAPTMMMLNYLQTASLLNSAYNNEPISIGNVAFNSQQVKSSGYYFDEDDEKYHSVLLTDGTRVIYPTQEENRMAMIYKDGNKYIFEGLEGAYIEGTPFKDDYKLRGCKNTTISIEDDGKNDNVFVTKYRKLPYDRKQYTENVRVQVDAGDVVNDRTAPEDDVTQIYE